MRGRAQRRVIAVVVPLVLVVAVVVGLAAGAGAAGASDRLTDAPDSRVFDPVRVTDAASYQEALRRWRAAEDVNAWIGARFGYDASRAVMLSETQRGLSEAQRGVSDTQRSARGSLAIHSPETFFASPRGICVDLSRFAVESLRVIEPGAKAAYLMIEFTPVSIGGNVLRRHWLASFERDGKRYFFADSKRPGFMAGPYASTQDFIDEYAGYRGREIVAYREMESYERTRRAPASRQVREPRP